MAWLRTRNTAQDAATKQRGSTNAKHDANRTRLAAPCLHVACAALCDRRRRFGTATSKFGDEDRGPNGLIRKRPPLVGNPVRFRIFRVPFRRSENSPGDPRGGAFFGSSPCVRKENCQTTSNFQVAAVPPAGLVHIRDRETTRRGSSGAVGVMFCVFRPALFG